MVAISIALMRVFPKAIVLTTKSHFHVKRTYASIRGLVVRTITSGKTRISAIKVVLPRTLTVNNKRSRDDESLFIKALIPRELPFWQVNLPS